MESTTQAAVAAMDLANVKLRQGDEAGHVAALEQALAIEPYCFPAMLLLGRYYESKGLRRVASSHYKRALKIVPPDNELSQSIAALVSRARSHAAADSIEYREFLQQRVAATRERHAFARFDRFDHCLDVFAGTAKAYTNEAALLLFPQLPAIPFFDNKDFPWLQGLADKTESIIRDLHRAMGAHQKSFEPYVDAPPGTPLNQWTDLNRSLDWSTMFFWREGKRRDQICGTYRNTAAACEAAPLAHLAHYAPTVMYSRLAAGKRIPPHTGSTNTRLVLHLPLIVPPNCGYRVGHITREWQVGVPWIFDDTIEHEAWNDSDEARVVLIFDVWNPLLSEAERDLVAGLLTASRDYLKQ